MEKVFTGSRAASRCAIYFALSIFSVLYFSGCTGEVRETDKPNMRYLPPEFSLTAPEKASAAFNGIEGDLFSRGFAQGDAVYAEIRPSGYSKIDDAALIFNGRDVPLTRTDWGYRAVFCIPPEMKTGQTLALIRPKNGNGILLEIPVQIKNGSFRVYHSAMDLGKFSEKKSAVSQETKAFIEECTKRKHAAFSEIIDDQFTSSLSHPRDLHYITSEFYSQRVIAQYKILNGKRSRLKDTTRTHWGTDLRGAEGSPVYAMASGKVALAGFLYYEGNMVILDHGSGIFTYYMHMADTAVKEGDFVRAGGKIGNVGSTGSSTGPHLHISLTVRKEHADPLSLLCLPIRD
ncbi:MAG: M23 family metallopeptidase [Spirochaetota bacterium]